MTINSKKKSKYSDAILEIAEYYHTKPGLLIRRVLREIPEKGSICYRRVANSLDMYNTEIYKIMEDYLVPNGFAKWDGSYLKRSNKYKILEAQKLAKKALNRLAKRKGSNEN